ncbi:autoinducer 2 ABC transporter substrate-binding protein [Bacillus sp. AFS073361]|uniref:autoinducer 2 ABC transporter substrate-binding protein n=1 Tax=Bacillus sp. AFS073361 TaxID=2033511 RepID=UPI000BF56739|nr:autoinducer 2 ABC transporter substrate-binding protein [Bacillus sp. AFS073361]PFP24440.1 autoinducer 2 ABC transporter substrate-binding protein [Bacillus sp. AFS073361]
MRLVYFLLVFILMVSGCETDHSSKEVIYIEKDKETKDKQIENPIKRHTIALVPRFIGDSSYYDAAEKGAKEAAEHLGINLIFTGVKVDDVSKQSEVIEQLIDKKVDVIAVSATDPFKLLPVLNKARKKGIKVITWDSDTDSTGRDFYVNVVRPDTLGTTLMNNLAARLNEKGEYAIITNSYSSSNTTKWIKWMKIQQEKYYSKLKLDSIMVNDNSYDISYQNTKLLLEKYPNLSAIVSVSPLATPAITKAVMEANRMDVEVLGLSLPNDMRKYIMAGDIEDIILWSPKKLGYLTVALAENLLNGQFPTDKQEIPNIGSIRVEDNEIIMGEPILFTKENINQYDF